MKWFAWLAGLALFGVVGWLVFQPSAREKDSNQFSQQADGIHELAQSPSNNSADADSIWQGDDSTADGNKKTDGLTRSNDYSILIQNQDGAALDGTLWVIAHTPELDRKLAEGMASAYSLWETSLYSEEVFLGGHFQLPPPEWLGIEEFAVQCAAPGFAPKVLPLPPFPTEVTFILEPIEPVAVQVLDPSGNGLPNARCWLRPGKNRERIETQDWLTGLQEIGYGASVLTDDFGIATFMVCYPGPNNTVQAYPEKEFAGATLEGLAPGDIGTLTCSEACTIKGRLLNRTTGAPLSGSVTVTTLEHNFDTRTVLTLEAGGDGKFLAERLPANLPVLFFDATSPGFARNQVEVMSPSPGSLIELDILLDEAASLSLALETNWGEPVPNTEVTLRRRRHGWESPTLLTDSKGKVLFPAVLPKGEELAVILGIEGAFWMRTPQNVRSGQENLVVDGLARILRVDVRGIKGGDEAIQFSWTALADELPGNITWEASTTSPLLPAGPGFLKVTTRGGMAFQQHLVLIEGVQETFKMDFRPAPLTFQWGGEHAAFIVVSDASGAVVIDSLEVPPGRQEVSLWEGVFHVQLDHDKGSRTWNRLVVPADGLDLGLIDGADDSGVWGFTKTADGQIAAGLLVNLLELGGIGMYFGGTDKDGIFVFSGVPPGEYRLTVASAITRGGKVPNVDVTIFLGPGEWIGPLELVVDSEGLGFLGRVAPRPPSGSSAWMLLNGHLQHQDLPMDNKFEFPVPSSATWFGVSHMGRGSLRVEGRRTLAGETSGVVSWSPVSHQISFVDELDMPRTDLFLHAYLDGAALPFQATPNGQGKIEMHVTPGLPLVVQAKSSDGIALVWNAEYLLQKEKVVVPRKGERFRLTVFNEKQAPLPLAAAMRYGIGDVFQANQKGEILLPDFDAQFPFRISAPGYLGIWLSNALEGEIALKPLLHGLVLDLGHGDPKDGGSFEEAHIAILTLLDLPPEAALDSPLRVPLEKGNTTDFPPLPAGRIEVELVGEAGKSVALREFLISSSKQHLRWKE